MKCIYCGCMDSKVIDSRVNEDGTSIRRRRECIACGKRFTTYETVEFTPVMVVKKSGGRQAFSAQKVKQGIIKACEKRPVAMQQIDNLVADIEKRVANHLDQEINDRGIALDMNVVRNAISFDGHSRETLTASMQAITGLENPNSVQQMKEWLAKHGVEAEALDKKAVKELIRNSDNQTVRTALMLRQQLAKSSVKKYQAMQNAVCRDGRAHGMFQFYGANRSGRWAGRLIQLQNLPQNHLPDLEQARQYVMDGDYDMLELLYDSVPTILSELIRTAFIPRLGYKFIVSDFSAIEARVLAHLAGETWRSRAFAEGKDIYCASASQMFGVPVEKHGINSHLRQKGKIAELALGYGGSIGALKSMGALDMGLSEEELQPLVNSWRASNPMITAFWWDVDRAVKTAITQRIPTEVRSIRFFYERNALHPASLRPAAFLRKAPHRDQSIRRRIRHL